MADKMTAAEFIEALNPSNHLGYPVYYLCADGGILSWEAAVEMKDRILEAIRDRELGSREDQQWDVIACQAHWEGPPLYCDHNNTPIESAYGDPEAEKERNECEPELLVDDHYGIYCAQTFVERYRSNIINADEHKEDLDIMEAGPDHEEYVEAQNCLDDLLLNFNGTIYNFYWNDGAIWAVEQGKDLPADWEQ